MLSDAAVELRNAILTDYEFAAAELAVLDKGLEAWDLARRAQEVLDDPSTELFYTNRLGEPTPHPAIRVRKDSAAQWLAVAKQLGIADAYGGQSTHGRGAQKARRA